MLQNPSITPGVCSIAGAWLPGQALVGVGGTRGPGGATRGRQGCAGQRANAPSEANSTEPKRAAPTAQAGHTDTTAR